MFIKKNKPNWEKLQDYINKAEKKGSKTLSPHELKDFLYLYEEGAYHLSYSNTHFPNSNSSKFLNALVGRAHNNIYTTEKVRFKSFLHYINKGFGKYLKECSRYIMFSTLIFTFGFLLGLVMVLMKESNAYYFLPAQLIEGLDYSISSRTDWNYPLMSSYIMTNNIGVALKAFILGITFGLGTIYILYLNGAMLGGLTGLIYLNGNPTVYWSLILPHGFMELFAIFVSGGAGFIIAYHLLVPGDLSRAHSTILGGKKASSLILGVTILLVVAGIIEGFFTPLNISPSIKLFFSFITLIFIIFYYIRANK